MDNIAFKFLDIKSDTMLKYVAQIHRYVYRLANLVGITERESGVGQISLAREFDTGFDRKKMFVFFYFAYKEKKKQPKQMSRLVK